MKCDICGQEVKKRNFIAKGNGSNLCDNCLNKYQKFIYGQLAIGELVTADTKKELYEDLTKELNNIERKPIQSHEINNEKSYSDEEKNSSGRGWINSLKAMLYIIWIVFFVIGGVLGYTIGEGISYYSYSSGGETALFVFLGVIIGGILGYLVVALGMVFTYIAENTANITDNTNLIIKMLKEK